MISLLALKCQAFRGLQFNFTKGLKIGHPNFKANEAIITKEAHALCDVIFQTSSRHEPPWPSSHSVADFNGLVF